MLEDNLLAPSRPLLVLPSQAAAEEVCQLAQASVAAAGRGGGGMPPAGPQPSLAAASAAAATLDAFLREVGLVVQYTQCHLVPAGMPPQPPYPPPLLRQLAATAQRLVSAAAACGCPALTELLLEGVCAGGCSAAAAAVGMEAACPPGTPLLHVAQASGHAAVGRVLREWAQRHGLAWQRQRQQQQQQRGGQQPAPAAKAVAAATPAAGGAPVDAAVALPLPAGKAEGPQAGEGTAAGGGERCRLPASWH